MRPGDQSGSTPTDEEIELKLHVAPEHSAAVLDALPLSKRAKGAIKSEQLESVYYDTEDLRLKRRGLTLRVRKTGDGVVQTLKAASSHDGVLMRRGEWEAGLAEAAPDLSRIDDPEARARCGLVVQEELVPLFATSVARRTTRLAVADPQGGRAEIEVAIDEGMIRAGAREVPISEVELELRHGRAAAVYELARALNAAVPLRLETESKAARGFALLADIVTPGVKASKLQLAPDTTIDTCFHQICTACLGHWTANQPAALDGRDPEGVHQMRVGLRRLRSAVPLFRHVLPEADADWLKAECGWLAASLGDARNWDVFIAELLAPVRQARPDDPALSALAEVAERERVLGYEVAREAIRSPRHTDLVLRLSAWLDGRGWREGTDAEAMGALDAPVRALASRLLHKQRKRALKRGRKFETLSAAERHRVRIALKRVRYSVEFFASLYPGRRLETFLEKLRALQDDLGHLNDVATAQTMLNSIQAKAPRGRAGLDLQRAAGLVLGWHIRGKADLEPKLIEDWHAMRRAKPFWDER
jgi:inorganic triphosphatase YgiF